MDNHLARRAEALIEAMPYIQRYRGKYFVVKVGGSTLRIADARANILTDVAFLTMVGIRCIIVCGGGPFISEEITRRGKKPVFIDGLRVTDAEVLDIVRDVLCGVRDDIAVHLRDSLKVPARSLDPAERYLFAKKIHYQKGEEVIDLGFVGQVEDVVTDILRDRSANGDILVMPPLAFSRSDDHLYNINADSVAAAVAEALKAEKLIFLTNVFGIMRNPENPDTLISVLNVSQVDGLVKEGTIRDGMLPKVKAATSAVKKGVGKVHIINGTLPHSILLEVFTDQGVGTEITKP